MFTGLIEEMGLLVQCKKNGHTLRAEFSCKKILEDAKVGDSIAINGVCQTVIALSISSFTVEISPNTLEKTTLGNLNEIKYFNLERALRFDSRLAGHLVQGHVNESASISAISKNELMWLFSINVSKKSLKYIIDEGSICIDGVSLTVSKIDRNKKIITIQIIPHTLKNTNLQYLKVQDRINVETDMMGRYAESLLELKKNDELPKNILLKWGY